MFTSFDQTESDEIPDFNLRAETCAEGRTGGRAEERNSIIHRFLAKEESFVEIADICDVSPSYV